MGQDEPQQDKRHTWFEARIVASLKLRATDLKKFFENEENKSAIDEFLTSFDVKKLHVYPNSSNVYVARTEAPEEMKKKGMYFFRVGKDKMGDEASMRAHIHFGDLVPDTLGALEQLSHSLFQRLLKSKGTSAQTVPPVYRAGLSEKTDVFGAQLLVASGLARGRTLLPIPELKLPRRVQDGPQDKELVFVIENTISAWTIQIRQAIASSPEELLNEPGRNPGPLDEIAFWQGKADNLNFLEEQLYSVSIAKMMVILKKANSSYFPGFNSLVEEVHLAAAEARDNHRFLKPLAREFEVLVPGSSNRVEFSELSHHFRRIMYFLTTVWTNNPSYNTPRRMVVLIRELCNDLICSAADAVREGSADLLAAGQADEMIKKLSNVLTICGTFKATYFQFKSKMNQTSNPWQFQNVSLFKRLDAFLERCHDIVDILETVNLFAKMEQMRVGGAVGIALSSKMEKIKNDFNAAHVKLQNSGVDMLDVDDTAVFDKHYGDFCAVVRDLELQLGTIMASAIDESRSLTGLFKVVDTFEGFTDRSTLSHEWHRKQFGVLKAYHADLLVVQELFNRQKDDIASGGVYPNLPPTATALIWCSGLIDRIEDPEGAGRVMELFKKEIDEAAADAPVSSSSSSGGGHHHGGLIQVGAGAYTNAPPSSSSAGAMAKHHRAKLTSLAIETDALKSSLLSQIRAYKVKAYGVWADSVEAVSMEKLQLNLLTRGGADQMQLVVNFDSDLVKALREVHYINKLNEGDETSWSIPQKAVELGQRREMLRSHVMRLDYIATTYNNIMENTRNEDEKPLLRHELDLFENIVSRGLRELSWMSGPAVEEFVAQAVESIRDIDSAVQAMHGNVDGMKARVADFTAEDTMLPLSPKKGDKTMPEQDVRKRFDEHIRNRKSSMRDKEADIKRLLQETLAAINTLKRKCRFSEISNSSPVWVAYVEYVNRVVSDSLVDSVHSSLKALRDQLDTMWIEDNEGISLMEIRLGLGKVHSKASAQLEEQQGGGGGGSQQQQQQRDQQNAAAKHGGHTRAIKYEPPLDAADALQIAGLGATAAGGSELSLEQFINDFANNLVESATMIQRLEAIDSSHTYMSHVLNNSNIKRLFAQISDLVRSNNEACHQFLGSLGSFRSLYENDMKMEFNKFMRSRSKREGDPNSPEEATEEPSDAFSTADAGQKSGEYFGLPLEDFHNMISAYERLHDEINAVEERRTIGFVRIDAKPVRSALTELCRRWKEMFSGHLMKKIQTDLEALDAFIAGADEGLEMEVLDGNLESLKTVMRHIRDCKKRHLVVMGNADGAQPATQAAPEGGATTGENLAASKRMMATSNAASVGMFPPIQEALLMLKSHPLSEQEQATVEQLDELRKPAPDRWINLNKKSLNVRAQNSLVQDREAEKIKQQMAEFEAGISNVATSFRRHRLFSYSAGGQSLEEIYDLIDQQAAAFRAVDEEGRALRDLQELFDLAPSDFKELRECKYELMLLKQAWDLVVHVKLTFRDWLVSTFGNVDVDGLLDEIKRLQKQLKTQPLKVKGWDMYRGLEEEVKNMATSLPLCAELRSDAMRERHWKQLCDITHTHGAIEPDAADFTLEKLINLGLHRYEEDVGNIVETAVKQQVIERSLAKIVDVWEKLEVTYTYNEALGVPLLGSVEEVVEQLDADNNSLQSMLSNRFVDYFLEKVLLWQRRLGLVESSVSKWVDIQRQWKNLYPIFMGPADIKGSLAEEVRTFNSADELFRAVMQKAQNYTNVIELMCSDVIKKELNKDQELEEMLDFLQRSLAECEKGLNRFLARKREIFARFFFVSSADLIDILSKGNDPKAVMVHMGKIVDSIDEFRFADPENPNAGPKEAYMMVSKEGEKVKLVTDFPCEGSVEDWMRGLVQVMRDTMKQSIADAINTYHEMKKPEWIRSHNCQAVVVARRIAFTADVHDAFSSMETGTTEAMRDFQGEQLKQLKEFINEVGPAAQGSLTKNIREMLKHLITIEVHNRDVVATLVAERTADSADCFLWQNQLRYYWRNEQPGDKSGGSIIQICDAEFQNMYEYNGICGCLVITPLTDRCYITLSQALRLFKGGAPAGPAGTGKTETTKDLARNLGVSCYVFNCSKQMTYKTLGAIFQGLAQSGCWGCFDEFNRISVEVLSVVATQVSSILNALRAMSLNPNKTKFKFAGAGDDIPLLKTVGMFITMNPGYAGRTELPENIKSLFRPCAMVVPDLRNISEIMLAAEGFLDAKELALKFVTLYKLNKELLSPQQHYDWGLRAVKSVLYIAGDLRRKSPDMNEKSVLMRALRDTNMAKLSRDDVYVFMSLITALFPKMDVPKEDKPELSGALKKACKEMGNVTGENDIFVLKCLQYEELLHVRHSVFILGPAGCGKTQCWKCLQQALSMLGDKCSANCLNPKAITSDEMYGYFFQKVDWRDGILSNIFRTLATESKTKKHSKWIVLDGIIDAEWIESMNTVMDDNKMLTLVSNDRIPLTSSMRMIFEVSHLKNASPATVSRGGVLYINESDLGWAAFKDKWVASRKDDKEAIMFDALFDKYVTLTIDAYRRGLGWAKPVVNIIEVNIVQTICFMVEGILQAQGYTNLHKMGNAFDVLEKIFCFCVIWTVGGTLPSGDGRTDCRGLFSAWWRKEFPTMKMSETGTVFDFFLDATDFEWKQWSGLVKPYHHDPDAQLGNVTVQTADTVRMDYLMSLFVDHARPVMLIGTGGTGKTNLIRTKLLSLDNNHVIFRTMSFNARTNAAAVQNFMEQNIEKRSGKTYGPPNRKQLICFFDDMNMETPDEYDTQTSMAFLQQHLNYGFWYDRQKVGPPKDVVGIRYVAAMNPKSGSFTVLDRVMRYFAVFVTTMPDTADLTKIYGQILEAHLTAGHFSRDCREGVCRAITKTTIELHQNMMSKFLPTAVKFHYQWNMRELFNIFQGMCQSVAELHDSPLILGRLWVHEVVRTFRDRMGDVADQERFDLLLREVARQEMAREGLPVDEILKEPHLFAPITITSNGEEGVYGQTTIEGATAFFIKRLEEYNESYPRMDLVLFKEAVQHVCRICRVISNPRGNALLVGVGGSGKQSLARLAAFICGQEPYQIVVTAKYNIDDFRVNMQELYRRTGIKGQSYTLIMTDSQIVSMDMLVYLNDMLSSGNVPELFVGDDRDNVINSMVQEVKLSGEPDFANPDVVWQYFINKVRTYFHIVLCFSPKSKNFASWCRQFPAIAGNTVIDWYMDWPQEALRSVSMRFLSDIDLGSRATTEAVAEFMAGCQSDVLREAEDYYRVEKRRCYATPKSFLELISLYKDTLTAKREALDDKTKRLVRGIETIKDAGAQVAGLQEILKVEQVEVEDARQKTQQLMEYVGGEKAKVQEQNEIAEMEEAKTNKIVVEVEGFTADCSRDLAAARPLVEKALSALNTLDRNSLSELKAMTNPPAAVVGAVAAVKCLTCNPAHIPPVRSRGWNEVKKTMGANVVAWLKELQTFDVDNIAQPCIDAIQLYVTNPEFEPTSMASASKAASGLCAWVIGVNDYHKVRCEVKPKEIKLAESQERLATSKTQLKKIQDKVGGLKAALDVLIKQYNEAVDSLNAIEAKAKKTRDKTDLAQRLVGGLSSENSRWAKTIEELKKNSSLLVGDVLLSSAFVSFMGPFSKSYREKIVNGLWRPLIAKLHIPMTPKLDVVMGVLTDEASVASWNNDGLPTDRVSTENGAITMNSSRWPLMIDPQLQGVKWIKQREEKRGLRIIQAVGDKWTQVLTACIEEGLPCMIESLGDSIDPVLDNVLGRNTFRKNNKTLIRIGNAEVTYNAKFRLFLQTRLPNPLYKPEVNAQTTLINFMVTESGLEDQLLAVVVNHERPELEERRSALIRTMNTMTIELRECEDGLLYELSNVQGDILENVALVENLENTKRKAVEINRSMKLAQETQISIANSRSTYQPVALRGALLFFQIDNLAKIDHMYQYSLEAFMVVFNKALGKALRPEDPKDVSKRVGNLLQSVTETLFAYVSRGLFERHKLIFASLLCFTVQSRRGEIDREQLDFLLRGTRKVGVDWPENVRDFIAEPNWQAVQALADVPGATPGFELLPHELDHSRWRAWMELEKPEEERGLPLDYKNLTNFQRLLVLRCLRPDRLTAALEDFVSEQMGKFFVTDQAVDVSVSYQDSGPTTPLFFILSPGVDPVRAIEQLGERMGITYDSDQKRLYNVSLGQGMEETAMNALEQCFEHGGWALLSNIHLVEGFVKALEKKFEYYSEIYTKMAQIARRKAELKAARRAIKRQHAAEAADAAKAGSSSGNVDGEAADHNNMDGEHDEEHQVDQQNNGAADGESNTAAAAAAAAATAGADGSAAADKPAKKDGEHANGSDNSDLDDFEAGAASAGGAGASSRGGAAEDDDDDDDDEELEEEMEGSAFHMEDKPGHKDFRVFLTAEPSNIIPIGILQRSIKLTSEPPSGIQANVLRAIANFSHEPWDQNMAKPNEYRAIMFAMCWFHSVVVERKKFGSQGWNRVYPFNVGDLTTCLQVTSNFIEERPKVPWEDLRYVFGEIMYGGHITDDRDRDLNMAYLQTFIVPDCLDGLELTPGFVIPAPMSYADYVRMIQSNAFPEESPVLYGLHPNAEINFRTVQADVLFRTINELQPAQSAQAGAMTREDAVRAKAVELLEHLPELHNMAEISERLEEDRTPQQHVFYQECERMNELTIKLKETLTDLRLGLDGALSISPAMQVLSDDLYMEKVPEVWQRVGFSSMRPLASWFENYSTRNMQLVDWVPEMATPKVTMLSYFFNPMSFLTAIMQTTSITHNLELDKMMLVADVLKKAPDQIDSSAREGAHVAGIVMEGARWDNSTGAIEDSRMKELYPKMPVVTIRAQQSKHADAKADGMYQCPMYRTQARGAGFVTALGLRTKQPARKWIIAGAAMLLDVVE